jgi:hypothetical protein
MKRDRNELPHNATLEPLTPIQETAIASLLAGKTVTDAAADAGVDRATVHRWLREHFGFRAALNAGRRELRKSVQTRLERLAERGADLWGELTPWLCDKRPTGARGADFAISRFS